MNDSLNRCLKSLFCLVVPSDRILYMDLKYGG